MEDADVGVEAETAAGVPLLNIGTGGNCTRSSGDLIFGWVTPSEPEEDASTPFVSVPAAGGTGAPASVMFTSPEAEDVPCAEVSEVVASAGVLLSPEEATRVLSEGDVSEAGDSAFSRSSSTRCRWQLSSSRFESDTIRRRGLGAEEGRLHHSPCTGSVCTLASQYFEPGAFGE